MLRITIQARLFILAIVSQAAIGAGSNALAQTQQQIEWCSNTGNPTPQQRIDACNAAIQSKRFTGANLGSAYYNRGLAYRATRDHVMAIVSFEEAVRANSQDADAYVARGNVHFDLRNFKQAAHDFTQAIIVNPNHGLAYKNRSAAYASMGLRDRAIADYKKAESLGIRH